MYRSLIINCTDFSSHIGECENKLHNHLKVLGYSNTLSLTLLLYFLLFSKIQNCFFHNEIKILHVTQKNLIITQIYIIMITFLVT